MMPTATHRWYWGDVRRHTSLLDRSGSQLAPVPVRVNTFPPSHHRRRMPWTLRGAGVGRSALRKRAAAARPRIAAEIFAPRCSFGLQALVTTVVGSVDLAAADFRARPSPRKGRF